MRVSGIHKKHTAAEKHCWQNAAEILPKFCVKSVSTATVLKMALLCKVTQIPCPLLVPNWFIITTGHLTVQAV